MVSDLVHAVIATDHEKGRSQMWLGFNCSVDLLHHAVHLCLLRDHVGTVGAGLVANVIKTKIMENHGVPVVIFQLIRHMARDIVVDFKKILIVFLSTDELCTRLRLPLTETKKLEVPSARANMPGKSFSQVSSPYMTSLPLFFAFICASQVSWFASVDDVSDSAKFRMTSKNDGIEPVVMALILGMVIVGDVACAVKGRALPSRMRLCVNWNPERSEYTKSLLSASTTMNMSRSNCGFGACPNSELSCWARPGMKGLYGKKPVAKTRTAADANTVVASCRTLVTRGGMISRFNGENGPEISVSNGAAVSRNLHTLKSAVAFT